MSKNKYHPYLNKQFISFQKKIQQLVPKQVKQLKEYFIKDTLVLENKKYV